MSVHIRSVNIRSHVDCLHLIIVGYGLVQQFLILQVDLLLTSQVVRVYRLVQVGNEQRKAKYDSM